MVLTVRRDWMPLPLIMTIVLLTAFLGIGLGWGLTLLEPPPAPAATAPSVDAWAYLDVMPDVIVGRGVGGEKTNTIHTYPGHEVIYQVAVDSPVVEISWWSISISSFGWIVNRDWEIIGMTQDHGVSLLTLHKKGGPRGSQVLSFRIRPNFIKYWVDYRPDGIGGWLAVPTWGWAGSYVIASVPSGAKDTLILRNGATQWTDRRTFLPILSVLANPAQITPGGLVHLFVDWIAADKLEVCFTSWQTTPELLCGSPIQVKESGGSLRISTATPQAATHVVVRATGKEGSIISPLIGIVPPGYTATS